MHWTGDENGEEIPRMFKHLHDPHRYRIPPEDLVVYNSEKQVFQLRYQAVGANRRITRDDLTMVVYIYGACDNRASNPRASYGVYFGPYSAHNTRGLLKAEDPQITQRAEIEALAAAIEVIKRLCNDDMKLQQIKIATDSAYLVDAMVLHIEGWIENGGVGSRGKPVAHFERLKMLHEMLDEMEFGDDGGIEVELWRVDRRENREADALANAALDGEQKLPLV